MRPFVLVYDWIEESLSEKEAILTSPSGIYAVVTYFLSIPVPVLVMLFSVRAIMWITCYDTHARHS